MSDEHKHDALVLPVGINPQTGSCVAQVIDEEHGPRLCQIDSSPVDGAECATLQPIAGTPYLHAQITRSGPGPVRVNSNAYRETWDRIFGQSKSTGEA